jgi:hypothetical protein
MRSAETVLGVLSHWRAGCFGNGRVRFGGGPHGKGPDQTGTSPCGLPN